MKKTFNKYFVPHKHNEYKPHILRTEKIVIFLGIFVFIEILFLVQIFVIFQSSGFLAAILPGALVDGTNYARASTKLDSLTINPLLQEAANLKAQDMAKDGYFAHTDPNGRTPWFWLNQVGYRFNFAGENLAVNFHDSKDVIDAWLNSEGHKANILNKNFTEIGIGTAKGIYKDREAIFIVQFFGRPYPVASSNNTGSFEEIIARSNSSFEENPAEKQKLFIEVGSVKENKEERSNLNNQIGQVKSEVTFLGRLAAAPKILVAYIYIGLAFILALALVLKVFVHMKIQHPKLILNGLLLIVILSTAIFVNEYLSLNGAQIF